MVPIVLLALAGLVTLIGIEILIRAMGISNFPLFARDQGSGYRMASDQKGRFLNRFSWRYDRFGMRSDGEQPDLTGTIVLLGDSVVEGGTRLDQNQTLASLVSATIGQRVYPVACHGWAIDNELSALTALPGWQAAAHLIWFVNSGDFDEVGEGESEFSFPTRRALWMFPWLVRRHLYRRNPSWWPWRRPEFAVETRPDLRGAALARFADIGRQIRGGITIVRYPMRGENVADISFFGDLAATRNDIRLIDPSSLPEWGSDCYLDSIHPNAHGVSLLCKLVVASQS